MSFNLLLLSTSRVAGGGFLECARDELIDFLAGKDLAPGADLSWLLEARMHFDRPLN